MSTLWKKEWSDTDDEVLAFTIGDDATLDNKLIPYDIVGSLAHAKGLKKIDLLSSEECEALCQGLGKLNDDWNAGSFRLGPDDEDMHSAIERALTDALGDLGKRIHAGRSRNDQVLTALRLYIKASLLDLMGLTAALATAACSEGEKYRTLLMPGYTHLQRAMPTTVAFWYASFAEAWAEALETGRALFARIDKSPLGAAAGFGVPLPLDREFTAELMGFAHVHVNAASVQNSRGRFEAALSNWLVEIGRDVEKMAWDLLLFSSAEFGFVQIPDAFTTGSSIMPQKRNPDIIELLRAAPAVQRACREEIEHTIAKLPSNYHRDYQSTKGPLIRSVEKGRQMLFIAGKLLGNLTWNKGPLKSACSKDLFATHRAMEMVKEGTPFRDAYRAAAAELKDGKTKGWQYSDDDIIAGLKHLGAPGNPGLDEAKARIVAASTWIDQTKSTLHTKWEKLLKEI